MICTKCNVDKKLTEFYVKNKALNTRHPECKSCYNEKYLQQCKKCNVNKSLNEFKSLLGRSDKVKIKTCNKCLEEKVSFPNARCNFCNKLFKLDFDPIKEKDKIPQEWICNKCKNNN